MKKTHVRRIKAGWIGCLLALSFAATAQGQRIDVLPPSGRWVTDAGDLLSPTEERLLSRKLSGYADTTSTQIVVVTVPSLNGVPASDYAVELGRKWGVGQKGKDNGVVILVSRDDRKVFIATGFGLEGAIPDAVAARIVRNILLPNFRQGRYYDGLSAAVDALMRAARGEYSAERTPRASRGVGGPNFTLIFILLIILFFVISAMRDKGGKGGKGGNGNRKRRTYRRHGGPPIIIWGGGFGGRHGGGGFGGGGFGGGGFGGGGGSFGGGGAGGGW